MSSVKKPSVFPTTAPSATCFHSSRKAKLLRSQRDVTDSELMQVKWRTQEFADLNTEQRIDGRQQYTEGVLVQQVGKLQMDDLMCNYCAEGYGPFAECIRAIGVFRACGNCVFGNRAIKCGDVDAPTDKRTPRAHTPRKRRTKADIEAERDAIEAAEAGDEPPPTPSKSKKKEPVQVTVRKSAHLAGGDDGEDDGE